MPNKCPDCTCPKAGDVFVCDSCKHTQECVRDCNCPCGDEGCECFTMKCCGTEMCKVNC